MKIMNRALFADNPDWLRSYCLHFHWQSKWDYEPSRDNRSMVIERIKNGIIQGYSAYSVGEGSIKRRRLEYAV